MDAKPRYENDVFAHGVASGDPAADSVVLWTRVSGQT
ncbi:MAG: PhoD-like phosphatase N-terminal domain-containing protein, partial [Pseudomonadota bacterium]